MTAKRVACLAVALLSWAMAVAAQPNQPIVGGSSILFNDTEEIALKKAILDFERMKVTGSSVEEAVAVADVPNVYVSALANYGEGQWTVWANGYRVTPGHQPAGFTVLSVSDDQAEIAVGGGKPAHFMLHPYQTWRARTRDVVEGILP